LHAQAGKLAEAAEFPFWKIISSRHQVAALIFQSSPAAHLVDDLDREVQLNSAGNNKTEELV
jgi:hypothetical protein